MAGRCPPRHLYLPVEQRELRFMESASARILHPVVAENRMQLLDRLDNALRGLNVQCIVARGQRLVLRYSEGPNEPSGLALPA